jgi:hypothetical protein
MVAPVNRNFLLGSTRNFSLGCDRSASLVVTAAGDVLAFQNCMRRALASFVVGVLLWGFVAPPALAVTTDTAPACCRRNRKHHCLSGTARNGASNDRSPSLRGDASRCPYHAQLVARSFPARPHVAAAFVSALLSSGLLLVHDAASKKTLSASSLRPRGPPPSFL